MTQRLTEDRRHRNKQQDLDWARWCGAFKEGVDDRLAHLGPVQPESGLMTWWYAAYLTGYLYGTDRDENREDLFEAARQVWA
jgi:hypothetical protein